MFAKLTRAVFGCALVCGLALPAHAAGEKNDLEPKHKIVIQSSNADTETQDLALVIAGNLQRHYGMDNVKIEIVGYAGGLGLLLKDNPRAERIKSLAAHDITFSACEGTLKAMEKQQGSRPMLTEGVHLVSDGVVRISELQEQGYSLIYPK